MKKVFSGAMPKIILGVIIIGLIIYFLSGVFQVVSKFEEFGRHAVFNGPYKLQDTLVPVINMKQGKKDTIFFQGNTVINFWATWCKPCVKEMPELSKISKRRNDIKVVLFSFDSPENQIRFIKSRNIDLNMFHLTDTSFFKPPVILPKTIFLRNDSVIYELYGAHEWSSPGKIALIDSIYN